MRKNIFFLLIIFMAILQFLNHSAYSEEVMEICKDENGNRYLCNDINSKVLDILQSPLDNITPNYQIIPIVDKTTINGGDTFTISYQVSGSGKVISNKLITFFPKELLKENPTYYIYFSRGIDENGTDLCLWFDKYPTTQIVDKEGALVSLKNVIFKHGIDDSDMIFGEKTINGHRPINIKALTNNTISAGDYIIKVQFFYSDGENWYSSQNEVVIHVREWYELWWFQIGLALLVGLGIFLVDLGSQIYILKKYERFECPIKQKTPTKYTNRRTVKKP